MIFSGQAKNNPEIRKYFYFLNDKRLLRCYIIGVIVNNFYDGEIMTVKSAIKILPSLLLVILLPFLNGCQDRKTAKEREVRQAKILQGASQCALPGKEFEKDIRIELLGQQKSAFGGKAKPAPVEGVKVKLVPQNSSDITILDSEAVSDAGGIVRFKIKAGKKTGDHYLKLIPQGYENASVTLRQTVGMQISGGNQEWIAGELVPDPISVKIVNPEGNPLSGVPVYFSISSTPGSKGKGASILHPEVITNKDGIASTHIKLGKATGEYKVGIEVADPKNNLHIRPNLVRVLAVDTFGIIMGLLGGLAFFLFGMELLSRGLQKAAGENMKKLLQFFSKNRFVAVIAGTIVTAVIQSSSATTVMVLGFINAGLINLSQAIGIIFGANIGTTVTGQIISFNLSGIALPVFAAGLLVMLSKNRTAKGWGESLVGFGLLFFGLNMMSNEMKILGTFPTFVQAFAYMDCAPVTPGGAMPVLPMLGAVMIGMIATFIIQSSSAAIGTLLVLSGAGLINFYTAIPIMIGTNIGTTITAFLASLTANRVAKQAALAHFLFNIMGAVLLGVLFYVPYGPDKTPIFLYFINAITPGDAFAAIPQNPERHIAMAHTFFNVITVLAILPFLGPFAKLCAKIIPVKSEEQTATRHLEPLLLAQPAVAIEQTICELRDMVDLAWHMINESLNTHFRKENVDEEAFQKLMDSEQKVDDMQRAITSYLVQITRQNLTPRQSEIIPILVHCTNDAERIADHTETILKLTKRLLKTDSHLSEIAQHDLEKLWHLLDTQANNVKLALTGTSERPVQTALEDERKINKLAKKYEKSMTEDMAADEATFFSRVKKNEQEITHLAKSVEQTHVERRNEGKCKVDASVIFIEVLWELERIGDRLANIATRAPQIQKHNIPHAHEKQN